MEKIRDKKVFQKKISTKFLVELPGTFIEYFWTWNFVNLLSKLFARENTSPYVMCFIRFHFDAVEKVEELNFGGNKN